LISVHEADPERNAEDNPGVRVEALVKALRAEAAIEAAIVRCAVCEAGERKVKAGVIGPRSLGPMKGGRGIRNEYAYGYDYEG